MAVPSRSIAKRIGNSAESMLPAGPSSTRPTTPILRLILPLEATQLRDCLSITACQLSSRGLGRELFTYLNSASPPSRTLIGGHSVAIAGRALLCATESSAALALAFRNCAALLSPGLGANILPMEQADSAMARAPIPAIRK